MLLDDAIEEILTKLQSILIEAQSQELLNVETVVLGDRTRMPPSTPVIWIFGSVGICDNTSTGLKERWKLPIELVAILKEVDNPTNGYIEVNKLAAIARRIILQDRKLGLSYVNDVRSIRFTPAQHYTNNNETLYGAGATIEVTFYIHEKVGS